MTILTTTASRAAEAGAPAPAARAAARPVAGAVVVIPALEPGAALLGLVAALTSDGIGVLVVDDGSGPAWDTEFAACERAGAAVVRLPVNRGKGAALRTALAEVRERWAGAGVVTADADGQHTLADIRRVRDELNASAGAGAPLVIGVRGFGPDVPLRSRVGNSVSALAFRAASGVAVSDTQTGLRGIPARHLAWVLSLPGDRYEYEYTTLMHAARDGIGIAQVPIATVYVDDNAASHFRPLRDSVRVLAPLLASLASSVLDTALFWVLAAAGAPLGAALAGARVVSAGANFSANRWLVFRGGRRVPLGRSALGYAVLAAAMLGAGIAMVHALTALGIGAVAAKVTADVLLCAGSCAVQRAVVFRRA
ncbi:glycosyltransferase [Brachybacterium huguangmaarense]